MIAAAFMVANPDAYADDVESSVGSWAAQAYAAREGYLDDVGLAVFNESSALLASKLSGGSAAASEIHRQLLKMGGQHSGDKSEDLGAIHDIIYSGSN